MVLTCLAIDRVCPYFEAKKVRRFLSSVLSPQSAVGSRQSSVISYQFSVLNYFLLSTDYSLLSTHYSLLTTFYSLLKHIIPLYHPIRLLKEIQHLFIELILVPDQGAMSAIRENIAIRFWNRLSDE